MLASPRSLSQRATSFIASWRQGIHRTLLSRSIHTTNARTQDQTPRYVHQLTKLTNSASLIHSFVHDTSLAAQGSSPTPHSRPRDQPIRFTCQTSRLPDKIPQDPEPGGKPVVQRHSIQQGTPRKTPGAQPTRQNLLETVGIEPTAPCLQSRCSTTELRPHIPGPETKPPGLAQQLAHPSRRSRQINGGPRRT